MAAAMPVQATAPRLSGSVSEPIKTALIVYRLAAVVRAATSAIRRLAVRVTV
jgi:hypothetical protein